MKKIFILLFAMALAAPFAFAQLTLSGEAKSGFLWQKIESDPPVSKPIEVKIHSQNDDAGDYEGRLRLNLDYLNESGMLGFKIRMQWDKWARSDEELNVPETWPYAFAFGNFFNNQLTVSIGKLGGSPWGTGGPEMWKELENTRRTGGIRFEYKPNFIPEQYGKLNVGFVLNGPEAYTDAGLSRDPEIWDILLESVFGLSYTHEYFMVRMAYRLDGELDIRNRGTSGKEGDEFLYRVEERIIQKYLPGFQFWALGYIMGVGSDPDQPDFVEYKNWAFIQYAPKNFTAQIRLGYEGSADRSVLFVKPNFYYKFFDGLLEVGALFGIAQDYGNGKIYAGSPYSYMEVMPKLQVNFAPGAYAAFEYYWKMEYAYKTPPAMKQTQWINLRFGIYF